MSGRKFRRKALPADSHAGAAADEDAEEEPGSLALPPAVRAARQLNQAPLARPATKLLQGAKPAAKALLSFGGDEEDDAMPVRGSSAKGRDGRDGRPRGGVARAAAVAVTEVRVGTTTQVSVAGTRLLAGLRTYSALI